VTSFHPGATTTLLREEIGDEIGDGIAAFRDRWAAAGPTDYRFELEMRCFCTFSGPFRVTVRAGAEPLVEHLGTSAGVDAGAADPAVLDHVRRTVPGPFDLVEERAGDNDVVVATFDDALGHPTDVYVDSIRNAIDDEVTYVVDDLQPL
jgi:hypothetical protein